MVPGNILFYCFSNKLVAVYGQHTSQLEGDCIVLTTHQLFRYEKYFDLLVMDEIDAFPFKGSEILDAFFKRSLRGRIVMMSATPSKQILKEFSKDGKEVLTLYTRFHKHPIPVPKIVLKSSLFAKKFLIDKIKEYKRKNKPVLVFVPTVELAESLFGFLSIFIKGGNYVSSKRENRSEIIDDFKHQKFSYLVTTAVLERGVTIRDVQVIIFKADDTRIYDQASLVQISGRAGRKSDAPEGEVIFLAQKASKPMQNAIKEIQKCNEHL